MLLTVNKLILPMIVGLVVALGFALAPQRFLASSMFSSQQRIDPNNLNGEIDTSETTAIFNNKKLRAITFLPNQSPTLPVLGTTNGEKRIEVDLTHQRLYAYEGDWKVFDFLISSGKWGRTPTGEFTIWVKLRSTKMSGGSKALRTYYYLPNVPYVMYFYNADIPQWRGYGIHGTYWHNNFGHPMSHGCINMKTEEVAMLYEWATPTTDGKNIMHASADNPGTKVIIYGEAPAE